MILRRKRFQLVFSVLIMTVVMNYANAQYSANKEELYNVSIPTPQAVAFSEYGKFPVDLFSGKPNVSIPLYQFPAKGLDIGINLSYNSGGIKPNERGGWTGVGWSLITTGTITRIQNGLADEYRNTTYTDPNKGYYWNKSVLNNSDWNTVTGVNNFLRKIICDAYLGTATGCTSADRLFDWAPDEFVFNIPGYSGSFWLDHLGNWVVRENNGEKLKVTETFGSYSYKYPQLPNLPDPGTVYLSNIFTGFTIKDGYGNKFIIGFDANNIEFNRNSQYIIGNFAKVTATAWYLKQIITKQGEIINYEYERKWPSAMMFTSMDCYKSQVDNSYYQVAKFNQLSGALHDPVHLKKITFNDLTAEFTYSENEINNAYAYDLKHKTNVSALMAIQEHRATLPSDEPGEVFPIDYKLDLIFIQQGNFSRQIRFTYYPSSEANRLFLKNVQVGNLTTPIKYEFDYYGKKFHVGHAAPNIIYDGAVTTKIDHWGYYTGKLPFPTNLPPVSNGQTSCSSPSQYSTCFPSTSFINTYFANREPILDSAIIGSLKKIKYPTCGSTEFIYELHEYSSKLNDDNTVASLGSNYKAGGLRIKEIKSYSGLPDDPQIKTYNYVGTNSYSSGVLNSGGVRYTDEQTTTTVNGQNVSFKYFYDNNQYPLQGSGGSSVNYSRAEEVLKDGSKTVYEYTNHDNGYRDIMPFTFSSGIQNPVPLYNRESSSRAFARGKLLVSTTKNSVGSSLTKETNTYEDDNTYITNQVGVRAISLKTKNIKMMNYHSQWSGPFQNSYTINGQATIWFSNMSTFLFYTYPHNLAQKEQITYDNSNTIITKEVYTYNAFNNKVKTKVLQNLSQGINKTTTFTYPNELTSGSSFYTGMVNDYVINPVIKAVKTNANNLHLGTNEDLLNLYNINQNIYLLAQREKYLDVLAKDKVVISRYDIYGNPESVLGNDGIQTSYKWGIIIKQPVFKILNAGFVNGNPQFFYQGFEEDLAYQNFNGYAGDGGYTGDYPVIFTPPDSRTYEIDYRYRSGGIWYYIRKNYTANMILNEGDMIDEVRVYPKDAIVTSYTYRPLTGMTSESDANNKTIFYEYDNLQRLIRLRDQDRNIVKQFEYNYCKYSHSNAVWLATGATRCKPCSLNSNYITNILQQEEIDDNTQSATYGQLRWTDVGPSSSCVAAVWQNTQTPIRCRVVNGENTGEQEQEQLDLNPCSSTYNQTRWVVIGTNFTACPLPCYMTCSGEGYKCVYDVCELGIRINTDSYYDPGIGMWVCIYHYEWSDGSWSGDYYQYSPSGGNCAIQ